ncbi:MAG: hypothetical protein ACXWT3_14180 [Methylococcaceae bacterium]
MKKSLILGLAIAGIALTPHISSAAMDDKYPAANFEPSVIYIDKDAVAADQPANEPDAKYPASNFQPKIVYADKDLIDQTEAAEQTEDEFDPKYPAAYFKPKVIYP